MQRNYLRAWWLVGFSVAAGTLLWLHGANAAPQAGQLPFRNPVEQREEMIRELREIKLLLKEQNALLRTWSAKGPGNAAFKHE